MEEHLKKLSRDERKDELFKELENGLDRCETIVRARQNLPIYQKREEIVKTIRDNKVVLIKGETGCGKTTQVPQYILEDCVENNLGSVTNILVTQPRRISAVSVANRVAQERGEIIGDGNRQELTVGYEIRQESKKPRDVASITFCTTGVILQKLKHDRSLSSISHLIIDEVHERDLYTDVLMGVVKSLQHDCLDSSLKVVVMSASLDIDTFGEYFQCPSIEMKGRTFKVERFYLEDYIGELGQKFNPFTLDSLNRLMLDNTRYPNRYVKRYGPLGDQIYNFENGESVDTAFVADLIIKIHASFDDKNGSILVFLPGWNEISQIEWWLTHQYENEKDKKLSKWYREDIDVFVLHSQVDMSKQIKIFHPAEEGKRKVILSTNIAETAITIDDVAYVIDCGKVNVMRYIGLQKACNLTLEWVAKSNSDQRAGRAGRTQPGKCWHLYSRIRSQGLKQCTEPAIKRSPLVDVVLQLKSLSLPTEKVQDFIPIMLDQPKNTTVKDAVKLLEQIGALEPATERLTLLGRELANMPVHPQLGKMVLNAVYFRCLEPILSIVAVLSEKDPFQLQNFNMRRHVDKARAYFANNKPSDHLMYANVVYQWEIAFDLGTNREFCEANFLNEAVLDGIYKTKQHILERLRLLGHLGNEQTLNDNKENEKLVLGILASGLYPSIKTLCLNRTSRGTFSYMENEGDERMYINQKSVNAQKVLQDDFCGFFIAKGNRKGNLTAQDCTTFDEATIMLFTPLGVNEKKYQSCRKLIEEYVGKCVVKDPKVASNPNCYEPIIEFIASFNRKL